MGSELSDCYHLSFLLLPGRLLLYDDVNEPQDEKTKAFKNHIYFFHLHTDTHPHTHRYVLFVSLLVNEPNSRFLIVIVLAVSPSLDQLYEINNKVKNESKAKLRENITSELL
jgi:hypothetical protein